MGAKFSYNACVSAIAIMSGRVREEGELDKRMESWGKVWSLGNERWKKRSVGCRGRDGDWSKIKGTVVERLMG